ncbi:MAG: lytic murein transglycosylase [Nitrospirales bacterium]
MKSVFILGMFTLVFTSPVLGATDFEEWVQGFKAEAIEKGIASSLVDQAFEGVVSIPRVLELDRKQPESRMTFVEYRQRIVSEQRIRLGREQMAQHRDLLREIGGQYGVQPRFIVALWGIETFYGKNSGSYPIVDALATLAFDGRRSQYFRTELLNAFRILQEGHISLESMKSSWAGAMGQCQFMPSSFLQLAVDHDGDGRKDIWNTPGDVFASAANYLASSGWRGTQIWGRLAQLPVKFDDKQANLSISKPLQDWQRIGIRQSNGRDLPLSPMKASVVLPDGSGGPAYLVYDNYRVIMKWNRSTYFATSVGLLADALAE